ncbi:hypothetical protein AK812_SmicGene8297 [Symbiodinium microadriaticum]|uniref:Uncharacterized protein n=1 Tax=Symbiodinium microadriaticum TaxID=2951 RepID=A0A1Q9ELA3_SYMMI|nr:hypothetical protein AK812_SmicGene8297 [Symbiodinium microadriaticum]
MVWVKFGFDWQNLFVLHFPDREYAQQRWMWFAPHVFSSIVWWNFAWIQLIKWIRAKHIWLHRLNGRIQVTAMMGQIITGIGLASGSPTHGVKMLSIAYGLAMAYVLANTIYYVRVKDIVRHKYWATKLFGYSQAIALQRNQVYFFAFFASTLLGDSPFWAVAPSSSMEQRNAESRDMFDDSFSMCIFTAIVLTEWYQAADVHELLEYRVKDVNEKNGLPPLQQPLVG